MMVSGGWVRDFYKMNPVNIAVIVNILHDFQDSLRVASLSVV